MGVDEAPNKYVNGTLEALNSAFGPTSKIVRISINFALLWDPSVELFASQKFYTVCFDGRGRGAEWKKWLKYLPK